MTTLQDRREADRKRLQRHREKQAQQGKRTVNATITAQAWEALQALKAAHGGTNSTVIGDALLGQTGKLVPLGDRARSLLGTLCERLDEGPEVIIERALRMLSESEPGLMVPTDDDF